MAEKEKKHDVVIDQDMLKLRLRLLSCLQTILDLEPEVQKLCPIGFLSREFAAIRSFVAVMEDMSLDEVEVVRIEKATRIFLEELIDPLIDSRTEPAVTSRFIQ